MLNSNYLKNNLEEYFLDQLKVKVREFVYMCFICDFQKIFLDLISKKISEISETNDFEVKGNANIWKLSTNLFQGYNTEMFGFFVQIYFHGGTFNCKCFEFVLKFFIILSLKEDCLLYK